LIRELAEAQRRTEEGLGRLAEAQRQTEERLGRLEGVVAQLAEAQRQTEERLGRLEGVVAQLAEAQRRTEETVQTLIREVGGLKGESLERRYRERAASYFQRILGRIRVVDHQQLGLLLDDAVDAGRIGPEERADALEVDVVVAGLADGQEVYLVAEVSARVTAHDVRRARRRAGVLQRAVGKPVLVAVAGEVLSEDPETRAEAVEVWRVLDGRVDPPTSKA
jgi:predicted nuclease with TOPRIM domain